jgi:hypothetical protein
MQQSTWSLLSAALALICLAGQTGPFSALAFDLNHPGDELPGPSSARTLDRSASFEDEVKILWRAVTELDLNTNLRQNLEAKINEFKSNLIGQLAKKALDVHVDGRAQIRHLQNYSLDAVVTRLEEELSTNGEKAARSLLERELGAFQLSFISLSNKIMSKRLRRN